MDTANNKSGNKYLSLDKVPMNANGRIVNINMDHLMRKKLTDMGLVRGTEFTVKGQAPLGDPIKINLRGYDLAIRKNDAKQILVEQI
ncbi:MAG TPA: ferrous iron transport protein A [Peptococcaceae bacterium]|nr:ferrous iron transport protein A [Peptococcaceae bacterium]